jgi:diguanylate cyclase (GGDEF)-like protein
VSAIVGENGSHLVSTFARTVPAVGTIEEILDHLVASVVRVAPHVRVAASSVDDARSPEHVSASDDAVRRLERRQMTVCGPSGWALREREPVLIDDLGRDPRFPRFAELARPVGIRAVSSFPLLHESEAIGVLSLYRSEPGALEIPDLPASQVLSDITAAHLLGARARDEARDEAERFKYLSLHDPLTGLPNRQLLETRVEHAAQRSQRNRLSAVIMFVDLDRFKSVNDTLGHALGDELLVAVARRLSTSVRPGDTVARVSGDEFVVLCEDVDHPDDVQALEQRIHEAFSSPFDVSGHQISVTASVGVAHARRGDEISMQLVVDADAAMYEHKRGRRHSS